MSETRCRNERISDAEWKLLERLDQSPTRLNTGRFLTLHKRRKKRPSTKSLTFVDDLYNGPTRRLLQRISDWPFNAFALDRATGGRPLPVLCFHLFHRYGLMTHFSLDPVRVWKFFTLVEEGYHGNNPYHNAIHAADVTQAMHCFLQEHKMKRYLTPLEILASLIAAMTHDLDHPGVNQPFLVATSNHLASLYKNASVLENHHWRSAMGCLGESGMMDMLADSQRHELQAQIQSLILATDITRQQEFLSAFKGYLDTCRLDMSTAPHRHFMLQIALKCADIGNPCRPWEVSQAWSLQVSEEFYRQGDLERRLGLPITLLCDRYSSTVSKIQSGFFRFIAAPLFEEWHRFQETPLSLNMLQHLRINQLKWDSILAGEERRERAQDTAASASETSDNWSELGTTEFSTRLPYARRRHSVPYGRPRTTLCRRESLPVSLSKSVRPLSAEDIIRDTSITSMTSWEPPKKKENQGATQPTIQSTTQSTSQPASPMDERLTQLSEDKENSQHIKALNSRLFHRRGSAPTALLPVNNNAINKTKFVRQGSLRMPSTPETLCSQPLKRRGSLPHELGRKLWSTINDSMNCWSSVRQRVAEKVKDVETEPCAKLKDRRRSTIRRRRSGGPELFASAVRRGSIMASAQLPPLPQGASCSTAKAKRTSSPQFCPTPSLIGSSSGSRDSHTHYVLGRRGSGPLELIAGIWNDHLPGVDPFVLEQESEVQRFEMKRPSIGSSSSGSDGPASSLFPEDWGIPPHPLSSFRRTRRRGSFPVEHNAIASGELSPSWMLSPR